MLETLLDACRFILEDQGEAQRPYWLASQADEMRLWRASESEVRRAHNMDIKEPGESSQFVKVGEDEYAFRSWTTGPGRRD